MAPGPIEHFPANFRSSLGISQPDQRHCPDQLAPRHLPQTKSASPRMRSVLGSSWTNSGHRPDQFWRFGTASASQTNCSRGGSRTMFRTISGFLPEQFWLFRAKNGFFMVYSTIAEIRSKFDNFGLQHNSRDSKQI